MSLTVKLWRNGLWRCRQTKKYYTPEQLKTFELAGFDIHRHY